jgi:peptidoglycan/xylan/chitin deacetylase (PgdA/CDA1 family)
VPSGRAGRAPGSTLRWGRIAALAAGFAAAVLVAVLALAHVGSSPGRASGTKRAGLGASSRARRRGAAAGARGATAEAAELRRLVALGLPVYCAGPRGDMVALTFDDGPGPYTQLAIRKLRKHGARATFFVVGRNLGLIPGITRQERALGAVGDHTFTHPLLTQLSPSAAELEITRTQTLLARDSGGPVRLFRPPYGGRNSTIDALAQRHGMVEILWTVDSADSLGANYAGISRNVIAGLHPGSIILMHENRGQTIRAMLTFLPELARHHLRAVSVPELLARDPPSTAQLRAGGRGCGLRGAVAGGS